MQGLSDLVHETVILVQPVSGLPVCTHRVEAQRMVRLSFEVGQYLPPLRGASAHLLAGHLSEAARRDYVEGAVERGERAPVGGIETFLADSARDAERGWSESHEEIDEGIWSAAAAIRSAGDFVGTLSVPCPQFRVDDRHRDEVIAAVREAAAQVSSALGS